MGKDQEFLDAARNGNITYIEKILNQRAKRAGPLASLRRGPGVNVQDSGGYSALHHASLNGHADIVRLLLSHEASTNLPDSRGSSPLHLAAWAGHQEIVKLLLAHPYRPAQPNLQTIENETPLHCASQHGHTGALAALLTHHADPNMRNARGETPLDLAAQYGRLQAVQMLIRAHPELIASYSVAAIDGSSSQSHKTRHASPLPHADSVSTPSPSSPSVISPPATPTRNIFPHTCLHLASRNGHKNVVEVLLGAGVSVNLLTPSGTALHEAALCGKETVVRTLLKAGIDLNATDAEGRTALDILKEFPPHVTKHIIAVINNFRNQMDIDDGEEVVYRHHQPHHSQRNSGSNNHYQKQQHNNHYHFNSNNHLLNHTHSMQQSSSYSNSNSQNKQRFANNLNSGKSLDSGLQPENYSGGGRAYHDNNSPVHSQSNNSQNEMGVSPSSSMSSFEPVSVSPRSRSSTGGIFAMGANPMHMSSFAPGAPPKKPPRRNLSVSPTHTGQQFTYTSPNHQQPAPAHLNSRTRPHHSPSTESPYSHQSHGSTGGMSFDETQLRDRQRADRLYASARESTRSATGILMSSSSDMLEKLSYSNDQHGDSFAPNANADNLSTNSMKRPLTKSRDTTVASKDIINCENPTLKSYNPNRKLKRNRNSYSLTMGDSSAAAKENQIDPKTPMPQSPTNYQQPPTPDHPPPSSSQAERTIHERIRPLSQEYKRRSALLQMQQQQQLHQVMIDSSTSPTKVNCQMVCTPTLDQAPASEGTSSPTVPAKQVPPMTRSGTAIQSSSGSLSSSVSLSDNSGSTDCVEEFVGDVPFAGLYKGSSINLRHGSNRAATGFGIRKSAQPAGTRQSAPQRSHSTAAADGQPQKQQLQQRTRPPIPTKPILPECSKLLKPAAAASQQQQQRASSEIATSPLGKTPPDDMADNSNNKENISACFDVAQALGDGGSHISQSASSCNEEPNETSNEQEDETKNSIVTTATQGSGILSPFNAEEARKKISEIIESFGSGILNSNTTPTNDIELEFDDIIEPAERRELAIRLRNAGLLHLERMLFENGYDNYKFVHGVFEDNDVQLMHISSADAPKLLAFVRTLPKAEFQPQATAKVAQQENKPLNRETSGVATLAQWLQSISLPEYNESFSKHLYNTIESVCGVWDVELQTVLEINKLGHRRRILQSVAYIRQLREPSKSAKMPLGESNETNKMQMALANGECKEPQLAQPQQRTSVTGYRKNRPAPQPPQEKHQPLQIRAPSELLLGLPVNLRTKWRHSANVLLNEQIKYEVYYLGSTVVKELRGTESTRRSIQKLKRYDSNSMPENTSDPNRHKLLAGKKAFHKPKPALVCLAISHKGVEFIDVTSKHTICEHEIQNINCACQDSDDLKHFAYITKENDVHYCHVFSVDSTDLATEIILTLGQAFEVAYQLALRDGITHTAMSADSTVLLGGAATAPDEPVPAE